MAGTGLDLELREKRGGFHMSKEQVEELKQQRSLERTRKDLEELAKQKGMTLEQFKQKSLEAQKQIKNVEPHYRTIKAW